MINHKDTLADMVFNAKDPDDILDAFCYVVGYTQGEIRRRTGILLDAVREGQVTPDEADVLHRKLAEASDQLEAGWKAFHELRPSAPKTGALDHRVEAHKRQAAATNEKLG